MLISAAICPHPPLLVAGLGPARDARLDQLRSACWSAVEALRAGSPDTLVVVGTGATTTSDAPRAGSLAPYGVDREVALPGGGPPAADGAVLPLSLCVGAWLLERDGWDGTVVAATVAADGSAADCVGLGERLAGQADRVALLVMADGSALRADTSPPQVREKAAGFDAAVARAVLDGDPQQLLALDSELGAAVGSSGVNPLRVLAGAAADELFDADVLYDEAPYGVGYVVGVWERHG
ncbi:hypothetical protein [Jiangella asiatica]|uniref:Extradiol ring-cleavage dioxygenase class III enzyme subunit B domain-containing protein n=1 Tax=Jiangella asiatica TaxID=2530372 RepID=A0A4R5DPB5_9ACTN|nr:hypothetical protein [Jiangella asiatica]TDE14014.1 hypothetical protein E1269_04490 [Jiangella asiatica]